MGSRKAGPALATLAVVVVGSGCSTGPATGRSERVARTESAIVHGTDETGWPAVAALVRTRVLDGQKGIFCTGSLVAPSWILTAAHCVTDPVPPLPLVRVYFGSDATWTLGETWPQPKAEALYAVDATIPHPQYDAKGWKHDIALVHLTQPVKGITPYAMSTAALADTDKGASVFYVGFGVDDPIRKMGQGPKRSISGLLDRYDDDNYYSDYKLGGGGTCYGDSGGPGFVGAPATPSIIGVNSGHRNYTIACETGYAVKTRVDVHADWLATTMAETPSCAKLPDMCLCAAACRVDGTCDDSACRTRTCEDARSCALSCGADVSCAARCDLTVTSAGESALDALSACAAKSCAGKNGSELETCEQSACTSQLAACVPPCHDEGCDASTSAPATTAGPTAPSASPPPARPQHAPVVSEEPPPPSSSSGCTSAPVFGGAAGAGELGFAALALALLRTRPRRSSRRDSDVEPSFFGSTGS